MKKKAISIFLIGIMVHSVYACGSMASREADHDEINEPVQEESSESGTVQDKEVSEETEATHPNSEVQQEADGESAEPAYIIEPRLAQDDAYEMLDWQQAYAEYVDALEWNQNNIYSLIYVDDDDIPELVIDTGVEAGGCQILTFYDGEIDLLQTARLNFYYIEKENLINNSDGHMGYYYDYIYSIDNGKWVCVADGEWTETMGDDDWVYQYEWKGKEVGEDVYEQRVNAVFNMDQAIVPDQYYILEEMLSLLRTGDCMSRQHRYELFIEDVTWDEARRRCEERGGYLATVTAIAELERIREGIEDSGQTDIAFWVGASCEKGNVGKWWHEPNQDTDSYSMSHYNAYRKFWAADEPSVYIKIGEGILGEDGVYVAYDDAEGTSFLYDAPKDILAMYPECEGKIGYICEYAPLTVMAKQTHYNADGSIGYRAEYEYDSAGNRTKYTKYQSDGSIDDWYEYEYDDAENQVKVIEYNGDGSIKCWDEYQYDNAGNQVENISYWSDGRIAGWEEYEYDSSGNETKSIYYAYNGSISRVWEWEYDSAGNRIKWIAYNAGGNRSFWYEHEYDSVGNEMKVIGYDADGSVDVWWEYEYDSVGNEMKVIGYDADGSVDVWWEYEYDSAGNETKNSGYHGDGSFYYRWEYEYDSAGNQIKRISYYADGSVDVWSEYEYDDAGNETRNTSYLGDGSIDYWDVYEYITITPHSEVTVSVNG